MVYKLKYIISLKMSSIQLWYGVFEKYKKAIKLPGLPRTYNVSVLSFKLRYLDNFNSTEI